MDSILQKIVTGTEAVLTWRARRNWKRKQKQKGKNVILDWVEAFIWSAMVVLLVNQYAFQAYEIPSQSMEKTLLVQDRVFVNKFIFGPELLPGMFKLPGFQTPQRGDIIIFENPAYESKGPVFDIAQRLIYMLTLSMVDIDRGPDGKPRAHFLVKRAAAGGGDTVRFRNGNAEILAKGSKTWVPEPQFFKSIFLESRTQRLFADFRDEYYKVLPASAKAQARNELGLSIDANDLNAVEAIERKIIQNVPLRSPGEATLIEDQYERERQYLKAYLEIYPNNYVKAAQFQRLDLGYYVPEGMLLPLGDNRDNSQDGRYFGAVATQKVLGGSAFRYWPIGRFGEVR